MKEKEKYLPQEIYNYSSFESHYNENKFWDKINHLAQKTGTTILRPLLQLFYTLKNENVSLKDKAYIIGALGYFILPTDVIPDFIVGLGFTDDLAVIAILLKQLKDNFTPEIEEKTDAKLKELLKDKT